MASRTRISIAALAIVAVALLTVSRARGTASVKPVTHKVNIENMQFQPDVVSAAPGDSIVWTNNDLFPHTATAKSGDFDSHDIKPGESWTYKVSKSGEIEYVCSFHPTMKAAVRVR
jgi:plastocyanin